MMQVFVHSTSFLKQTNKPLVKKQNYALGLGPEEMRYSLQVPEFCVLLQCNDVDVAIDPSKGVDLCSLLHLCEPGK